MNDFEEVMGGAFSMLEKQLGPEAHEAYLEHQRAHTALVKSMVQRQEAFNRVIEKISAFLVVVVVMALVIMPVAIYAIVRQLLGWASG